MKLRAHHIVCMIPLQLDLSERGTEFIQVENKIKEVMSKGSGEMVEVMIGVDELCHACPLCQDNRCQSPNGDEDSVRKWDAILLKGLGVSPGTTLPTSEWRKLIKQVKPMSFCQTRCPYKDRCAGSRAA